MNVSEALKLAGDYADSLTTADDITNRDTMAVAAALDAAYESKEWVAEWLEQKPAPKSGRAMSRFQDDSRNRFAQWVAWRLEQDGRSPLHGSHTYRLLDGATIARTLNFGSGEIQSEATVRPLKWFLRYYKDRIPDVWAIAVDLAGGDPRNVTRAHVKRAVAHYKGEVITPDVGVVGETLEEQLAFALGRGAALSLPGGGQCYEVSTRRGILRIVDANEGEPVDIYLDGELITFGALA